MPTATEPVLGPAYPPAPATLEEAGLTLDVMLQIALKTLYFAGELSGSELARRLGVAFSVVEPALEALKVQRHCEIVGSGVVGGPSYRYRISDAGRVRAAMFLDQNRYVGVAPVPIAQYRRYMDALDARPRARVTRDRVRRAFSELVLSQTVLDQLGPAINAGRSIFIYGPPGNGKTVISQAVERVEEGVIPVPYALEVEGNLVRMFDPVNHQVVPQPPRDEHLDAPMPFDTRWVPCHRPLITVGGELTIDALDLQFSPVTGIYHAPVQALANGGVLVIDDFGRQHCSPRDLLNRWIVPLENRIDYLTLQTGQKFALPFTALVVFATNIRPAELVDEAFLRRIQYKILARSPTAEEFIQIFENYCRTVGVPFERALVEHMLQSRFASQRIPLRGCQPRDLINHALSLAAYRDEPRRLTPELLDAACASYFVDDLEAPATDA